MSLLYTRPESLALCGERDEFDHYPTPDDLIVAALERLDGMLREPPRLALDVGAGLDGRWCGIGGLLWPGCHFTGVEYQNVWTPNQYYPGTVDRWYGGTDFMTWMPPQYTRYDLVLGNIPYSYGEDMIRKMYHLLKPGGWVIQLLLLNFVCGQKRANKFWRECPLLEQWPSSKRPGFRLNKKGKKGTDAREYGLFIWRKGYGSFEQGYRGRHLEWAEPPKEQYQDFLDGKLEKHLL